MLTFILDFCVLSSEGGDLFPLKKTLIPLENNLWSMDSYWSMGYLALGRRERNNNVLHLKIIDLLFTFFT